MHPLNNTEIFLNKSTEFLEDLDSFSNNITQINGTVYSLATNETYYPPYDDQFLIRENKDLDATGWDRNSN